MPDPVLEIKGLSAYYGALRAIRDIDLSIAAGECVCLIGPNGAGKTTLLKAISGVLERTEGEISYLGRAATHLTPRQRISSGLIHVPEGRLVFSTLSVADNLRMGGYAKRGADLGERIDKVFELFPRLRERRRQPAGNLSGGEQQMLAIGRALVAQPTLLMLDEPSMGLAPVIVAEIYREIRRLREMNVTVLLVEQNARLALEVADRAVVLGAGVVRRQGSCRDLSQDSDVRHMIFGD
ncbi:ABC transporter ATP-binding protein [Chelatococcus reniformis]|uniref:ABC transporter ATP-binding protein n=1 Tax=Chelatococcus reniformis TaxID=1494448 RepID=A0A916XD81_9HYPH|nr:ABC transporter ATP-binding protein [Chelatococcus reniformis]GGC65012.1 ABC transporter ATP-binding protein [Chelatococcus reniformis]